jgi:hypothetical protein
VITAFEESAHIPATKFSSCDGKFGKCGAGAFEDVGDAVQWCAVLKSTGKMARRKEEEKSHHRSRTDQFVLDDDRQIFGWSRL